MMMMRVVVLIVCCLYHGPQAAPCSFQDSRSARRKSASPSHLIGS